MAYCWKPQIPCLAIKKTERAYVVFKFVRKAIFRIENIIRFAKHPQATFTLKKHLLSVMPQLSITTIRFICRVRHPSTPTPSSETGSLYYEYQKSSNPSSFVFSPRKPSNSKRKHQRRCTSLNLSGNLGKTGLWT
jgi:hypothetical protein